MYDCIIEQVRVNGQIEILKWGNMERFLSYNKNTSCPAIAIFKVKLKH